MTPSGHVSGTIGYAVVAHKEGALLGEVVHVFFDPDSRTISGMTVRSKAFGNESWFGVEEIEILGRDVILLTGEASLTPVKKGGVIRGKSLQEMRSMRVVTQDGKLLGRLDDLEVQGKQLAISELYLYKNLRLLVDHAEIRIGPDQIMVPSVYSDRVVARQKDSPGGLRRIFGAKDPQNPQREKGTSQEARRVKSK
jgi:sporulation protein YlmC with PRC-barrel domain